MSASTINTIANAHYAETLTQVQPSDLRSIDLRKEAVTGECDCLRSSETGSSSYSARLTRSGTSTVCPTAPW